MRASLARWSVASVLMFACTPEIVAPPASPTPVETASASRPPVIATPTHADLCRAPGDPPAQFAIQATAGERYAFVASDGFSSRITLENEDTALGVIDAVSLAVSPDRRLLAYWSIDPGAPDRPRELRLRDLTDGSDRAIPTSAEPRGGAIAWSCDHTSMLIAAVKPGVATGGRLDAPPPEYTSLRLVDLRSGVETELARFAGETVVPLAWNARLRAASAFVRQRSHVSAYLLVRGATDITRWELGPDDSLMPETIEVDPSATIVSGRGTTATPVATGLFLWPIEDAARRTVRRPQPEEFLMSSALDPGAAYSFVVVRGRRADSTHRLELWPADPQSPAQVLVADLGPIDTASLSASAGGGHVYVMRTSYRAGPRTTLSADAGRNTVDLASAPRGHSGRSVVVGQRALRALAPPAIAVAMDRQQAIARIVALTDKVRRVDRSDAKLVAWSDVQRTLLFRATPGAASPDAPIWAVAIAGDILADTGSQRVPLYWGVWFIDANSGEIRDFNTDARPLWRWPTYWDQLLDRAPNPPPRPPAPGFSRIADFSLGGDCGYATDAVADRDRLVWLIDCGPASNRSAASTLGPMLERQGWRSCGGATGDASWAMAELVVALESGSAAPPGYIRVSQRPGTC